MTLDHQSVWDHLESHFHSSIVRSAKEFSIEVTAEWHRTGYGHRGTSTPREFRMVGGQISRDESGQMANEFPAIDVCREKRIE